MTKPWSAREIVFALVLTEVELNPIGLIKTLSFSELYLTTTCVELPTPIDLSESKSKVTLSPFERPCAVETATCDVIFCALPVIWANLDSNLYSKLSLPLLTKKIGSVFAVSAIPI